MLLGVWMEENNVDRKSLSEMLGVSVVTIGRYLQRKRRPSPEVEPRILSVTGGAVTPNDFCPELNATDAEDNSEEGAA